MDLFSHPRFGGETHSPFAGTVIANFPLDRINSPACLFEQREDSNDFCSHIRVHVRWELIGQVQRQRTYLRSEATPAADSPGFCRCTAGC
jgi:hypothetical protein